MVDMYISDKLNEAMSKVWRNFIGEYLTYVLELHDESENLVQVVHGFWEDDYWRPYRPPVFQLPKHMRVNIWSPKLLSLYNEDWVLIAHGVFHGVNAVNLTRDDTLTLEGSGMARFAKLPMAI